MTAPGPTPPETFDALRKSIRDRYDDFSPHLQRIARLAIEQPNQIALQTVAVIAEDLDIQPSTLIRFSKELGYSGFSQLQRVFRHRLIEGAPVDREQIYKRQSADLPTADLSTTMTGCVDGLIRALEDLRDEISIEDLSAAIDMLQNARHVYVAGLRRSRPIATYLAYGLNRLERQSSLLDFGGGMAEQQVANMGQQDLLFAIAYPPYAQLVVDIVRDAHFKGAPIITMTDSVDSPLAKNATVSFMTDQNATGRFRPISGAIGLVQVIIETLAQRNALI